MYAGVFGGELAPAAASAGGLLITAALAGLLKALETSVGVDEYDAVRGAFWGGGTWGAGGGGSVDGTVHSGHEALRDREPS